MTGITQMLVAGQILDVGDNWIASLGGTGITVAYDVSLDSSNNIYVIGYGNISNSNIELASYDINGAISWQRSLGGTSTDYGYGVKVDSANNVCIVGQYTDGSVQKIVIAKYDLSGVIQWQRVLSSVGLSQYARGITTDTSNNIYIVGTYGEIGYPSGFFIAKYNSSGAIQWQRSLRKTSNANGGSARKVAIDTSNNIYVFGSYDINTSGPPLSDFVIAKYTSSGAIQWQYKLGLASTEDFGDITVTSSGDIYTTGSTSSFSPQSLVIVKYDSLCNVQWQNRLYLAGQAAIGKGITVDYAGYVYVCGSVTFSGSGQRGVIAKYDSSGVIQWQRYFRATSTSAYVYFESIKIDSFNNLIVSGYTNGSGTADFLTVRLPSDGTKTGTYSLGGASYVYENSSLTDSSIFLTLSTSSLVDASTSLTDAAGTLTDASTSLTANLTVI
jgi:hypothetical protein